MQTQLLPAAPTPSAAAKAGETRSEVILCTVIWWSEWKLLSRLCPLAVLFFCLVRFRARLHAFGLRLAGVAGARGRGAA